jgi:hypothetical protein
MLNKILLALGVVVAISALGKKILNYFLEDIKLNQAER